AMSHSAKIAQGLAKLKYLVVIDPLATETSEFWRNAGDYNDVDPAKVQTEVFRLPAACFAEETGSFTNSGRVINWKQKAVDPPGEARTDGEIMALIYACLRALYEAEGGAFPAPVLNLH